jgi:hypothetical protein
MNMRRVCLVAALAAVGAVAARAQRWEVGGGAGTSFYANQTVENSQGQASIHFQPRFGTSAYLGQDGRRFGGELRYDMIWNQIEAKGGSGSFKMPVRTHSLGYNLLVFFKPSQEKVRPYVLMGAGVRRYEGRGQEVLIQPTWKMVLLTKTSQLTPMVAFGAGVKTKVGQHGSLRAEVKVFTTPMPKDVITPMGGANPRRWLFEFYPNVTLAYCW